MKTRWQEIDNPWAEQAKEWLTLLPKTYILHGEEKAVEAFNEKYRGKDCELQLQLPPQPFQGTPDAKIWVLLQNSGYTPEPTDTMDSDAVTFGKSAYRKACLQQLFFERVDGGYFNYVLNPGFERCFGKQWFEQHFKIKSTKLNDARATDERFFLLQTFGYASIKGGIPKGLLHTQYNKELLKWAVQNGKIIVFARCLDYWVKVVGEMWIDEHPEQFFCMASPISGVFSSNNLLLYHDWLQKEDCQNIDNAKQRANEFMQNYLDK